MSEPTTSPPSRPKPGPRKPPRHKPNPELFIEIAKKAVVDNYNMSRDEAHAPEIGPEDLFITWYGRILQNWEVTITSPVARRLLWQVSYNNYRNEIYIIVYQKINAYKVALGEKVPS
jgi:hypothetical protein